MPDATRMRGATRSARHALVLGAALLLVACGAEPPENGARASTGIRFLADDAAADGFERALEPRAFEFPADHGAHPGYRTEWWYFTGNLDASDGRHFGFEVTFFRLALRPEPPRSRSEWATNQVWMAHFALSDVRRERLLAGERLTRGALELAGARAEPFRVWVEDWSVEGGLAPGEAARLQAQTSEFAVDLQLSALERPVPQGDRGLDAKGPEPGNASHYYSIPRFAASGNVRVGTDAPIDVEGQAWMDREWSTSALSPDVAGWDWFALQLEDGRELMYYRLRREDGTQSAYSGGTLVTAAGQVLPLAPGDVDLTVLRHWRSRATGVEYPVAWAMQIPGHDLDLEIRPYFDAQEVRLSVRYWEGAVQVTGTSGGEPAAGRGYLELAGY